jgi:hypothetical protein
LRSSSLINHNKLIENQTDTNGCVLITHQLITNITYCSREGQLSSSEYHKGINTAKQLKAGNNRRADICGSVVVFISHYAYFPLHVPCLAFTTPLDSTRVYPQVSD